jgi:hypothetical protein
MMFGLFKKRLLPRSDALDDRPASAESRARGVLPTFVTAQDIVLCKAGPTVRNTCEIRLALFMAKAESKRFVLMVKPDAVVEESIVELLRAQGGELRRSEIASHSVYVGCLFRDGSEDGWVLGDDQALAAFRAALKSAWLREQFKLGALIPLRDLLQFGNEMWEESADAQNVDGENAKEAVLALMVDALKHEGSLFIQ